VRHIVLYSGGLVSWRAADLAIKEHGSENVELLFTDTSIEDPDLYRFLMETWREFGEPTFHILCDGRTPWEVFKDVRYLGNTRIDPCSRILKPEPTRKWLNEHCSPEKTTIWLGFDVFEDHRFERAKKHWSPWTIVAPLTTRFETRPMLMEMVQNRGIEPPRLYLEGASHNNCGGGCIKAGIGHFEWLYRARPETFSEWEANEQEIRDLLGDVAILRDRSGGEVTPLPLTELRQRIERDQLSQLDLLDVGGCGCFADFGDEE